jgi:hypothetical protein
MLAVPRGWLLAVIALIIVPWVLFGFYIWWREAGAVAARGISNGEHHNGAARAAATGPWGHLTVSPIVVSPPLEYIGNDWGSRSPGPAQWYFPGASAELLDVFLTATGLGPDAVARLRSSARRSPDINGLVVTPDPDLVARLDPQVRARLYGELAKTRLNFDQANAFRFHGSSFATWFHESLISPETRRLVEPLVYRNGDHLHFADVNLIRRQVTDIEELRRLAKTLLRQPTVLVELSVRDSFEVDSLVEYWGRGGRRTDLRPLLESAAAHNGEGSVDIVHLLPTFARNHLYRYPKVTTADLDKPLLANCLWSALNFFNAVPDDRYLDINTALDTLRRDYFIVESGFQLGDIIAFMDQEGNLFHMAVYLAGNLVFSKNGTSPVSPWAIQTVEELKDYYRVRSANPRLIYHRRNDL